MASLDNTERCRNWRRRNKEKYNATQNLWYAKNKDRPEIRKAQKNRHTIARYGITVDEYNKRLEDQNFKCAICKDDISGKKKAHLDHDHRTGKLRKMLCMKCNIILGHLEKGVAKYYDYLEQFS